MSPSGILETALYVRDIAEAVAFLNRVFNLACYSQEPARHAFYRFGSGMLLLFNPATTLTETTTVNGVAIPRHGTHGPGHLAFAIRDADYDAWRSHLTSQSVRITAEVVWPNGGRSIYFRDPSGNVLELATPRLWGLPEPPHESHSALELSPPQ